MKSIKLLLAAVVLSVGITSACAQSPEENTTLAALPDANGASESEAASRNATSDVAPVFKADQIVVYKSERRMELLHGETVIATYAVELGRNPVGQKHFEGDGRTPEGSYYISTRNPNSRFHRSLRISYPNADDASRAREWGIPAGGAIMIHGQSANSLRRGYRSDWTEGCIAVTNAEIDQIWYAVDDGTPVLILP